MGVLMRSFDGQIAPLPGRQEGFSYLWVLLLVAFMGLSLTIAAEIDATAVQRGREKELLSIGRQFRVAIARYYETQQAGGVREYPDSFENLLHDNRVPGVKRHLRKIYVDPMTSKPEWGVVKVSGRIVGVHSMSSKLPIKQDGFEAEDINLRGKSKYAEWLFVYPPDLMLQIDAGVVKPMANEASSPVLKAASQNEGSSR